MRDSELGSGASRIPVPETTLDHPDPRSGAAGKTETKERSILSKRYELEVGGRLLSFETGDLAQQAAGAVLVRYADTMVLGTVTAGTPRAGIDFFPLSVEFEERLYAAGRIPGSFFRREGRPTTTAILSARLTDRPIRPLFPAGYGDDTQIVLTVLSVDMVNSPDTLGTIAASAALTVSDLPFDGPVASVRIGYVDGKLVVLPTFEQLASSSLNLVVAGTKDAIMMVEAESKEVPESLLLEALALGQVNIRKIVELQEQMRAEMGKPTRAFTPKTVSPAALARVEAQVGDALSSALSPSSGLTKAERDKKRNELQATVREAASDEERKAFDEAFGALEKRFLRGSILEQGTRPDGRGLKDIRPLKAQVGMIPRTHGSGLFQRGETQVLSLTTLAGTGMAQRLDDLSPENSKRFMHHYNFPPFSVGEVGRIGSSGRREIGHGMLGERAMAAVLPPFEDFPYTIRVVSEVLSSNGSTSMASVCASILSMMDAGVPIKHPIAGVAMGLIKGESTDQYAVLTDIAGVEDYMGDMDFKVAGSRDGVTALQMDIKVSGITIEIMEQALEQAREARLEILGVMQDCLASPRSDLAPYAPRMSRISVASEKIGLIIGPGGRTIRQIEEETGASVDIEDNGSVFVTATDQASGQKAIDWIRALTKEVEVGEVYTGKVVRILPFGAFVEILPGKDAMVHISELADHRVATVEEVVKQGEEIKVVITEIDNLGRVNASRRALLPGGGGPGGGDNGRGGGEDRRRDDGDRKRDRDRDRGGRGRGPRRDDRDSRDGSSEGGPPASASSAPAAAPASPPAPARVDDSNDDEGGVEDGPPRRRRRRRKRSGVSGASGGPASESGGASSGSSRSNSNSEDHERQPDSNVGSRSRIQSAYTRLTGRRSAASDEPAAPPPPPRPDFGAPGS